MKSGKLRKPPRPRIVFFGTPVFGQIILKMLLDAKLNVVAVVTQPDPSPVKILAKDRKIPVLTPNNKQKLLATHHKLATLKPKLFIVAFYEIIIPPEILEIPSKGALNVRPSLLPQHRGPSPIQTAILEGDSETGVTIVFMDEEMDHGPILSQKTILIAPDETTPTLTAKLAHLGGNLLMETIPKYLSGKIIPHPQNHERATFTKPIKKKNGKASWARSNERIERTIRAYKPWPGVWTTVGEMAEQLEQELKTSKHKNLKLKLLAAHLENGVIALDLVQVGRKKPTGLTDFAKEYLK